MKTKKLSSPFTLYEEFKNQQRVKIIVMKIKIRNAMKKLPRNSKDKMELYAIYNELMLLYKLYE